ncbi:unnamed protein product, partial [Ectocarpus sp. 6 AP-2014]
VSWPDCHCSRAHVVDERLLLAVNKSKSCVRFALWPDAGLRMCVGIWASFHRYWRVRHECPIARVPTRPGHERYQQAAYIDADFLLLSSGGIGGHTDGNIYGHACAKNCVAVAAINWQEGDGPGGSFEDPETSRVEHFSSTGPCIVDPGSGKETREKPTTCAADGLATSTTGFSEFLGTSASAPVAAAIATIVRAACFPRVVEYGEIMEMLTNYEYTVDYTNDADGAAETWGNEAGHGIISAAQMLAWVEENCSEACSGASGSTPAPTPTTAQPGSLGCYKDDPSDRVLTAMWSSPVMTPSVCAAYCHRESASYAYYAIQYGGECWCQDTDIDLRHGEATCDYACSGDASISCGGFYAFTLYDLEGANLPTPPADDNYVGCFADDLQDRVLGAETSSNSMTSEACADYCANESPRNMYYATQYGAQCWCAEEVDLRHGEGRCAYACTGDAKTTCGGFEAFDLFELNPLSPPTEDYYVGCFADDLEDRVLEDVISAVDMTLEACENHCTERNKPFFALQYSVECWCGGCEILDDGPDKYDRHGAGVCNDFPCSGDPTRQCGGLVAFSLYERDTCGKFEV